MGTDYPKSSTRLREYLTVLEQRDGAGEPFVIVGGQAVNFWAELYSDREPRLSTFLPFNSKDLDVIGTAAEAVRVALNIGWYVSPPVGGGPVQAVLSSEPGGAGLAVEFLSQIKGVSQETIVANVREGVIRIPGTEKSVAVRVLDPVLLLAGKLRNAVDIEQDLPQKPRQDVKHVAMLAFCVPHFLHDLQTQSAEETQRRKVCGKYVTMLAALKNTYSGRQFEARHPGIVRWAELVPEVIRQMPLDYGARTSLQQLAGNVHSRGIGI